MPPTVEYRLTPDVAARAADAFVRVRGRDLGRKLRQPLAAFALYAGVCAALALAAHWTGADDWFRWALVVMAALAVGLVGLMLALHGLALVGLRAAARRARRDAGDEYTAAPAPVVRWTFTDDGFVTQLGDRVRATPWAAVRSFTATSEFWIVGVTKGPDLFLPLAAVPDDARELVRRALGEPATG